MPAYVEGPCLRHGPSKRPAILYNRMVHTCSSGDAIWVSFEPSSIILTKEETSMLFYPEDAQVPAGLRTGEFVLEPLRTTHVELDYAALMESKAMLRRWSQSDWPSDDFTLEENYKDLDEHEREHQQRVAFTYTVLNPEATECLGCVYIRPLAPFLEQEDARAAPEAGPYRARTAFWVRQSRLADDLDRRLLLALISWFERDWAFSRVVFFTSGRDERQMRIFAEAGLRQIYVKEQVEDSSGQVERWVVYA